VTRPQKCKIEKYRCRKWEAEKPKNTWFSGLEFIVEKTSDSY